MGTNGFGMASVLIGSGLLMGASGVSAGYLLNEDFDDGSAAYTSTGTVNIRPATDILRTAVNTGFDSYTGLAGQFLAIGDAASDLANPLADGATGPIGTATGQLSRASFSLGQFTAGTHRVGIAFNYVFDTSLAPGTTGARSPDDFYVQLVDGSGLLVELLRFNDVARNEGSRRGLYSAPVDFSLASAGPVSLTFSLVEFNGTGDSAVGVDNLSVIPVADSLALLGIGMAGLGIARRRRSLPVC